MPVTSSIEKKINRNIGKALADFPMIEEGDRILVAVSGGKDSLCLLHFLKLFQKKSPVHYDLHAVHISQGYSTNVTAIETIFHEWNVPFCIVKEDFKIILQKVLKPGTTPCSLCSRLRRGLLYKTARDLRCNKIALGHHKDDLINTFMMNLFYSGKLGTMTPIYKIKKGDLKVIRPLYSTEEDLIRSYVNESGWNVQSCSECGEQKRQETSKLMATLESSHAGLKNSIFRALSNVHKNEMLDRHLWNHFDFAEPNEAAEESFEN